MSLLGQLCTGLLGLTAPGAVASVLPPRQARIEPTVAMPRRASMRLAPEAPLIMGGCPAQREIDWATVLAPAKPPHGVVPDDIQPMAMDEDLFGAFEPQINAWAGLSGYAELTWLGYPYLAELSQRSEYRQIVETLAKEMTRRWVKIVSKSEEDKSDYIRQLEEEINRFKVRQAFRRIAELDGFFGRGQIFIDVGTSDNNEELKTPLMNDIAKIAQGSLKNLRVIEPMWTYPGVYNSSNPLAPDWYEPKQWYVMGKTVHASRLITFISREMPDLLKPAYSFGGISMSQISSGHMSRTGCARDKASAIWCTASLLRGYLPT